MHSKFLRILRSLGGSPAATLSTHLQASTLEFCCAEGQHMARQRAGRMQPRHSSLKAVAAGTPAAVHSTDEVVIGQTLCAAQGHNMQYQSSSVCARAHAEQSNKRYLSRPRGHGSWHVKLALHLVKNLTGPLLYACRSWMLMRAKSILAAGMAQRLS